MASKLHWRLSVFGDRSNHQLQESCRKVYAARNSAKRIKTIHFTTNGMIEGFLFSFGI